MKKVLKTILMGAVAFSLAMGVGCVTGENSSLEKESSKAEDSSSQNKRRQLRDKSDYGKVIALTFDDGPNTDTTPLVLDKLEEHGIVASFFVIGNNITDESAEVMKRAYNMGCDIENHSQSHPDMTKMTADECGIYFFPLSPIQIYRSINTAHARLCSRLFQAGRLFLPRLHSAPHQQHRTRSCPET